MHSQAGGSPSTAEGGKSGGKAGQGGSTVGGQPNTAGFGGMQSAGSGGAAHRCETQCVLHVFKGTAVSCKLCHSGTPAPAGLQSAGLDLESYQVTERLQDVPAKHSDITGPDPPVCPVGDKLIDTGNPKESWLLKKIRGQQGNCGNAQPEAPTTLKPDELACLEEYISCVAGGRPLD